jgi:hypothetical protein
MARGGCSMGAWTGCVTRGVGTHVGGPAAGTGSVGKRYNFGRNTTQMAILWV